MTTHETAAARGVRNWTRSPEGAHLLHLVGKGVDSLWDGEFLDAFGQHYRYGRGDWPLEQVYSFGRLHIGVAEGNIGFIRVRAGGTPWRDSARAENAALLTDLPEPFHAEVSATQNCADSDGRLTWTQPIEVEVTTPETVTDADGLVRPVTAFKVIAPGSLPLEIGTTLPSRTLLHIGEDRGVARWPYESEFIWLLANMEYLSSPDPAVPGLVLASH